MSGGLHEKHVVATWKLGNHLSNQEILKKSAFCAQRVFMCFVHISEQTAIISLYDINWFL